MTLSPDAHPDRAIVLDSVTARVLLRVLDERDQREVGFTVVADALFEAEIRLLAAKRVLQQHIDDNAELRRTVERQREQIVALREEIACRSGVKP